MQLNQVAKKESTAKQVKREKIFNEFESPYICAPLETHVHVIKELASQEQSNEKSQEHESSQCTPAEHYQFDSRPQVFVKYLDLSKFKIDLCKNLALGKQHNHKHCRYYHSIKDRRRILDFSQVFTPYNLKNLYSFDLCDFYESNKCAEQANCLMSHNRVESVYHPSKYKTKYCTKFPKNLDKCEYKDYCSFAHSHKELKTRLIHQMKRDHDFYMFYFKTEWCPFNKEHNKAQCPYAHNYQDFRRKPNVLSYDCFKMCANWRSDTFIAKYYQGCKDMASCPHSHGWKEQEYHPVYYKTVKCSEWSANKKCSRGIECPFYHDK